MQRVEDGEADVLDSAALRDRYQQVTATAYGLLADFREADEGADDHADAVTLVPRSWASGTGRRCAPQGRASRLTAARGIEDDRRAGGAQGPSRALRGSGGLRGSYRGLGRGSSGTRLSVPPAI
ncbi:DUF3375 family protein [Streptomyces sp. NPDC050636]|uniref:DUF3375 family protein n=1 Tax=Streptomyces sp. NPDC050636 TaxID=3154510 RepID=UPI0034320462